MHNCCKHYTNQCLNRLVTYHAQTYKTTKVDTNLLKWTIHKQLIFCYLKQFLNFQSRINTTNTLVILFS